MLRNLKSYWKTLNNDGDQSFRLGKNRRLRLIDKPGNWMEDRDLDTLIQTLSSIARQVTGTDPAYGIFTDRTKTKRVAITIIYDNNEPVAFNILPRIETMVNGHPQEILHLGLVMVAPSARSNGLSSLIYGLTCILLFLKGQMRPMKISSVTQVPAIVGLVGETFDNVYPKPGLDAPPTFEHLMIARSIMRDHSDAFGVDPASPFDEKRFVIQDSYTGGSDALKKTYDVATKSRIDAYNALCLANLDYERGDDFLQIGTLNLKTISNHLRHNTSSKMLGWTIVMFLQIGVGAFLMPILHWFDTSKKLGILRARNDLHL